MLSETHQIPVDKTVENKTGLLKQDGLSHLFAEIRRLRQRVIQLETQTGNNRRDISRLQKYYERSGVKTAPSQEEELEGLFGIGGLVG